LATTILTLALMSTAQSEPAIDRPTLFALLQRYQSSFRDVSFIHEGTFEMRASGSDEPLHPTQFQTYYAYRSDGATLVDLFSQQLGEPKVRVISSILHRRLEVLDATPEGELPIAARVPESGPGGPGSLGRYDSPERIFLAWYFSTLGDAAEHEIQSLGWEDVDGHRCLKVSMLRQPRPLLKGWVGELPYIRLWIDPQRDALPIRYEYCRGNELEVRGEITRMERVRLPDGRTIWFPSQGRIWGFLGKGDHGQLVRTKEPTSTETHTILIHTVKFNQGLNDAFFSVKKHALVASDEGLRKLQRELESESAGKVRQVGRDPESHRKRLDEALKEADRQSQRLEASSAARSGAGWFGFLTAGMGAFGVILLGAAMFWYWKNR
jgi:hypothetical protein